MENLLTHLSPVQLHLWHTLLWLRLGQRRLLLMRSVSEALLLKLLNFIWLFCSQLTVQCLIYLHTLACTGICSFGVISLDTWGSCGMQGSMWR